MAVSFSLMPGLRAADSAKASSETPAEAPERAAFKTAMSVFLPEMDAHDRREPVDFRKLRAAMEGFWAAYPEVHGAQTLLTFYMDLFAKSHPEQTVAEWTSFTRASSPIAADLARGKLRFFQRAQEPFELKFIALDGRAVDLAKWRGKVVLIDFWATWCAPCVAELPNLKNVYAQFHDQGFEVVGVSLDLATDKQKLLSFIAHREVPWPQHFDGKVWQNEIARQYAINALPTTFLLDRAGNLVATNLRGEKLFAEIKRLLDL